MKPHAYYKDGMWRYKCMSRFGAPLILSFEGSAKYAFYWFKVRSGLECQ